MSASDVLILFGGSSSESRVSVASAPAFDKEVAKQIAASAGVRIAQSVHLSSKPQLIRAALAEMVAMHGRVVAKPVAGGSSVGLYHLRSAADVETAASGIEESG